jgi:hypothetical protein
MIRVETTHGPGFIVHDNGQVERPGLVSPSDSWQITGAVRLNNFGAVVQRYSLMEVLQSDLRWRYANGKPRIYLMDIDHGTCRMQGSPSVYDVRRITPDDLERSRYNARLTH